MKIFFRFEKVSTVGDLGGKLEKFFLRMERKLQDFEEEFKRVWVEVVKERGIYRVKGIMRLPGRSVVVEEKGKGLIEVATKVRNGLVRMVRRYKGS